MKLVSKKLLLSAIAGTLIAPAVFAQDAAAADQTPAPEETTVAPTEQTVAPAEQNDMPSLHVDTTAEKPTIVLEIPTAEDKLKIQLTGLIQGQYIYASASGGHSSDQNGFSIRRAILGFNADFGDDWSAKLTYEFDSKSEGGSVNNGYIDVATISRKFGDIGTLSVGHRKVHFMLEEYTSSSKLPCIERSFNSNFLTGNSYAKGIDSSHIGVFWDGNLSEDIDYGLSLTNAVAKDYDKRSNNLAITGNIGSKFKLDDDSQLYLGLNATVNFGDKDGAEKGAATNAGTVFGLEPYVRYDNGGLSLLADFFYVNGDSDSNIQAVYGLNLTATYRMENNFEPAIRFTYLNTESGLVNANTQNRVPDSGDHNCAATYYFGVNYYFNKYVRASAGYEFGHYFGNGGSDSSGAFRTMLQISF
ncbi:MAG: OprO/OprP family phosphate-selective porin [Opitutae bacterium]|nr:OprO/OprP family phosphate-selective porin [Opitutae bacterium]